MKKTFSTEAAYVVGILVLAIGTGLMEKANLGMSMVVAPAYILHLQLVGAMPWFTFGAAEYTLQAALLLLMTLVLRRFRVSYLFSFVTAVVYGLVLDGVMVFTSMIPGDLLAVRLACYVVGLVLCSVGVAFIFHTYIAPEVYELIVKEFSAKFGWDISKCKTCYDCISCAVGVILSFAFFGFGHFEGVKAGTIVCALVNGWLIGRCTAVLERYFTFEDKLKLRKYF